MRKVGYILILLLLTSLPSLAENYDRSTVNYILQQDFPLQPAKLLSVTDALYKEYQDDHQIISLIFYAYGSLKLGDYYRKNNDFVKAAEYSKTGFFYLDEAAESHEDDWRIGYLRARIDAFLPSELGRCVIAIKDTEKLTNSHIASARLNDILQYMRYSALNNCGETQRAEALLVELKKGSVRNLIFLSSASNVAPAWDIEETTKILLPLVNGE